jgi:hypothetical protein
LEKIPMKRSGYIKRKTPLRAKKPLGANIPAADALFGIWGLKRVKKPTVKGSGLKRGGRLPRVKKGRLGALERDCESLWAAYIKMRYGNKSVLSGAGGALDACHLYGRGRLTTKFHPLNGVPLTRAEADHFTQHPAEFYKWVRGWWKHETMTLDDLERMSNIITHPTEEWFLEIQKTLRQEIANCKEGAAWLAGGIY